MAGWQAAAQGEGVARGAESTETRIISPIAWARRAFSSDYIRDLARVVTDPDLDLDFYAGLGGFIGALSSPCGPGFLNNRCNDDVYAGARVPLGLELLLKRAPFTVGLEIAPGLGFAPGRAGFLLDFLLAGRVLL